MEKSAKRAKSKKFTRLLISLCVVFLCNANLFAHYYSRYVFAPIDEYIFQGQESIFEVVIPNVKPVEIQVTAQNLPDKVTFISSDKTETFNENGVRGTRVRVTYRFEEAGFFRMPSIAARIRYGSYNLSVQNVNVLHNPETIQPIVQFKVHDENTKFYCGQKIPMDLLVTFAAKIENFHVTALENSVIVQDSDIKIDLPITIEKFSDSQIKIAQFDFIPLESGKITVPTANVRVKTWKGSEKIISSEKFELNILKAPSTTETEKAEIKDAGEKVSENSATLSQNISGQNKNVILKIADLRMSEKKSVFPWKIQKERKALEKQIGLEKTENEFPFIIFLVFLLLFAFLFVLLMIAIKHKKKSAIIAVSILVFLVLLSTLVCYINMKTDFALILDENIYAVPEDVSSPRFTIKCGTRVRIKGEALDWVYVNCGGTSRGWIKRENLIFLR